jgi:phage virion morphogenesis protein
MFEIKIDDKAVMSSLDRLAATAHNMSPVMRVIAQELARQTEKNFAAEGRPKWLGIKPRKGREGGHILQDTGQLAASITTSHDASSATIGSNKVYAAIHQLGGDINKPAQSRLVRHRTDAKGNLLRTEHFKGKGLIFAKDSHKRAVSRWFEQGAHVIHMPARPFLPIDAQGQLQSEAADNILGLVNDYLRRLII